MASFPKVSSARSLNAPARARILMVDDRPANLLALEAVLTPLGHDLVRAESGEEALKCLLAEDFAVILLDVQMPGMDGFETASLIKRRERSRNTPILFVTAISRDAANVFKGYGQGAVDYLLKPVDPDILRCKVAVFVDLYLKAEKIKEQAEHIARQEREVMETVLSENEERYRTLFELCPVAVYSCDLSGVIQSFNGVAAELWGREPAAGDTDEQFCGSFRLFRPDGSFMPYDRCPMADVVSGKLTEVRDGEVMIERPDGSRITVVVNIRSLKNQRGEVTGAINCFYDITARKRAEDERGVLLERARSARESAESAVRDRDEFMAMLGHELRNPLGAILFASESASRVVKPGDPVARQYAIIDRQARRLSGLVDDLLVVARVTSKKVQLKKERLDLRLALRQSIETTTLGAQSGGAEIVEHDAPTAVLIDADPIRLEQILTNLLTNARKYTPKDGRIDVSLAVEKGMAVVRIRDNGVGLAPAMRERIFDLFTQVEATIDRSLGGMGIGLTLVRNFVEMHGGSVSAESGGLGLGAEFIVRLPLSETAAVTATPRSSGIATGNRRHRIVLVEDNDDLREGFRELLEQGEHHVKEARDGNEGLARILAEKPDVAIVDIGLPGMDGFEVARRVRATLGRSVFLVALTGYGGEKDRVAALSAGFDAHLTKPLDLQRLEQILDDKSPIPKRAEPGVFSGEIAPCEHLVQIYEDDRACLDTLEGFISGGLRAHESTIIIATQAHLETLARRLEAGGCNLAVARSENRYIALDADETLARFMVNRWPDEKLFVEFVSEVVSRARGNGRRVRAFGEMVALLWARGEYAATARLEHLWTKRCEAEGFALFCAYPKAGFTKNAADSISEICAAHSRVYPS